MNNIFFYIQDGDYLSSYGVTHEETKHLIHVKPHQALVFEDVPEAAKSQPNYSARFNLSTNEWEETPLSTDDLWIRIRAERKAIFDRTAWIRERASDQGLPVPQEWINYWQVLRDITLQPDPANIIWPEQPQI